MNLIIIMSVDYRMKWRYHTSNQRREYHVLFCLSRAVSGYNSIWSAFKCWWRMVAESACCSQIMSTRKIRRGDNTRVLSIHVRRPEIYNLPNLPTRWCAGNGEWTSGGNEMCLIVVTCLSEYRGERRVHVTGRSACSTRVRAIKGAQNFTWLTRSYLPARPDAWLILAICQLTNLP